MTPSASQWRDPDRLPETYADCLGFLFARNQFAMKLGLEGIHALLERLGRPEIGGVYLHVAGTNGKGSVCANLAALLRVSGHARVGLYTSPHLVSFRERIQVDGQPITKEWVLAWMRKAFAHILELQTTYFECVTAMALDYFHSMDCEAAVLETGLGGRLDATNAVLPALTIITSVSLDHTAILGDSVEAIWNEKIGILKPGVPMVVQENRPHLLDALKTKAAALRSPVYSLRDFPWSELPASADQSPSTEKPGTLRFQGRFACYDLPASLRLEPHQKENLALSLLAMEVFLNRPLPPPEILSSALKESRAPGRTQLLEETGMLPLLLDGAHNPAGMAALAESLRIRFPERRILVLFSVMRDKEYLEVYRAVKNFSAKTFFVPLTGKFPRALGYAEMLEVLPPAEREELQSLPLDANALANLLRAERAPGELDFDLAVVCGSLYLLGEVIPMLLPHYTGLAWFRQFEGEM